MAEVRVDTDCGNSPRREFLKNFNISFVNGDFEYVLENMTEDIVWEIAGGPRYEGKQAVREVMQEMVAGEVAVLTLERIITHGKEAAVSGRIQMQDGSQHLFCDVMEFQGNTGNQVRFMRSFIIEESAA